MVDVVVTGASGFLGRAVVRALHRRDGVRVTAVSRRHTADAVRVEHYSQTPDGDVLIHLAEEADRAKSAELGACYESDAARTIADLLNRPYNRVIYASSAVLYGDAYPHPHAADDPVYATDAYTRVKRSAELAVLETTRGVVARLSNVYGPGMSLRSVISTILQQIPGSGPLVLMHTTPVRDFLWVDDAAEAFAELSVATAPRGVFNVATGVGTSIGQTAQLALDLAGEGGRDIVSSCGNGLSTIIADYARMADLYGWRPHVALREGLEFLLSRRAVQHR